MAEEEGGPPVSPGIGIPPGQARVATERASVNKIIQIFMIKNSPKGLISRCKRQASAEISSYNRKRSRDRLESLNAQRDHDRAGGGRKQRVRSAKSGGGARSLLTVGGRFSRALTGGSTANSVTDSAIVQEMSGAGERKGIAPL